MQRPKNPSCSIGQLDRNWSPVIQKLVIHWKCDYFLSLCCRCYFGVSYRKTIAFNAGLLRSIGCTFLAAQMVAAWNMIDFRNRQKSMGLMVLLEQLDQDAHDSGFCWLHSTSQLDKNDPVLQVTFNFFANSRARRYFEFSIWFFPSKNYELSYLGAIERLSNDFRSLKF